MKAKNDLICHILIFFIYFLSNINASNSNLSGNLLKLGNTKFISIVSMMAISSLIGIVEGKSSFEEVYIQNLKGHEVRYLKIDEKGVLRISKEKFGLWLYINLSNYECHIMLDNQSKLCKEANEVKLCTNNSNSDKNIFQLTKEKDGYIIQNVSYVDPEFKNTPRMCMRARDDDTAAFELCDRCHLQKQTFIVENK